jgi:hypothetical protein
MSIELPQSNTNRGNRSLKPILRIEIEEAQRNTHSNSAAARWLGVSYIRYRKYAKLYGLFDRHLNASGVGIDKGWSKNPTSIPLKDILAGKHPKYSLAKLKNRLVARKKLVEACNLCGFQERRITDQKVPLMLTFKDGDRTHFELGNLELLCYNCMFLTTGAPSVVNRSQLARSYTHPQTIPQSANISPTLADQFDPGEPDIDMHLTDAEKAELLQQL